MAVKKDTIPYDLSGFDKDVVAYIGDRLEGASADAIPKEAFHNPAVLVDSLLDDSYKGAETFYPEQVDSTLKAIDYLNENMEPICTVLDMSASNDEDFHKKFSTIWDNPQQTVLNVYAEEAKQLLSSVAFYYNQQLCQEQANERLNAEDLKQINADLERKPYERKEDVVQFHGVKNGKPYTFKYDYKKTKDKAKQIFNSPDMKDVCKEIVALADRTASNFRVVGPQGSMEYFNQTLKSIANDVSYNVSLDIAMKSFQQDIQQVFHSEGMEVSKPARKVSLKARDNGKEHTLDRID